VKHMARAKAQEEGAELILVDGPPGIGCPVISALSGADIVVIVSEPTLSGLSDFGRIADLAQGFGAKCALVVNKADVNCEVAESLLEESRRRDIPCIGWVPYDEGLLSRMAMGAGGEADELSPAAVEIAKSFEALRWLP
jgi:MinD superfamily P-loop ATPase